MPDIRSSHRLLAPLAVCLLVLLVASCASLPRNPVPEALAGSARPLVGEEVRSWGDAAPSDVDKLAEEKYAQTKAARPQLVAKGARPTLNFLALSGGGSDGAFGAGLLAGWTAHGDRPEFEIVTGISTGALSAPFVFLGPVYDGKLKEIYTRYSTRDLLRLQPLRGLFGGAALANNTPLQQVLATYVDEEMLAAVAREHRRGRRLLIGTTNIDAQRPVIWNMGRIAASGHPDALRLFREVLLASAAIPGVLPPVSIRVSAGGETHEELHVDGGTTTQVFLLPRQLMASSIDFKHEIQPKLRLYIVRNGRIDPEYKAVEPRTLAIASRSISTLIKNQGIGDLYQLYGFARRNKMDYNLAYIPASFSGENDEPFDVEYMTALYDLGYRLGRAGYDWKKSPERAGTPP